MIAVSDAVLIVVSAAILGTGLYRWQGNLEQARQPVVPVSVTSPSSTPNNTAARVETQSAVANSPNSTLDGANLNTVSSPTATSNSITVDEAPDDTSSTDIQRTPENVVITEPLPTTTINVADDDATTSDNNAIADVPAYGSYLVRSGDSLSLIAEQFGTSVSTLQSINGISGSLITVGQELRYPLSVN